MPLAIDLANPLPIAIFALIVLALLYVDMQAFARGREPTFREAALASVGWLVLSLLVAIPIWLLDSSSAAVNYTTVYLIERSLSLDNLVVFLLLFAYFGIPGRERARLLFWGIIAALVLRGVAIAAGTALLDQFHWVVYVLGATLLLLAYRILRGAGKEADPEHNVVVRLVRRVLPGASVRVLAIASIVAADIAFAVDSIPAAFAITTEASVIWMANAFALLGMRALFVLVQGLVRRFRYLNHTVAIVLALVGVKLLIQDAVTIGPAVSLAIVVIAFTIGIVVSVVVDRRERGGRQPETA